jgi:hypothetical protein
MNNYTIYLTAVEEAWKFEDRGYNQPDKRKAAARLEIAAKAWRRAAYAAARLNDRAAERDAVESAAFLEAQAKDHRAKA